MPRDGAGNFSLVSGNPVVTNTIISSTTQNNTMSDVAAGLTQSLSRDGQTTPTADLTMGNFKLRNLAAALARTDAVNAGQVQDGSLTALSTVSGTDTITASSAPAITAYAAGQFFEFVAAGANATTAVTLNINALGAKSITKSGATALAIGDIQNGQAVCVYYDGTRFQMLNPSTGRLMNIQVFTSSGTYTPITGATKVYVRVQGAGGGGGGAPTTNASQVGVGVGGNAGAYAEFFGTASSQTITVGSGGTAGAAGSSTGGTGGSSSFGALCSAAGGAGGNSAGPTSAPVTANNGSSDAIASGGIINIPGFRAVIASIASLTVGYSGAGANSMFGRGGTPLNGSGGGTAASGFGAGGSGGLTFASQVQVGGGAGSGGFVMVYEYS